MKKIFKYSKKFNKLEVMNQNAMYICTSWYIKICWFPLKQCWYQHNSRGVSRDLYIFGIFVGSGITFPSFVIARYVWQILGRIAFLVSPHTEELRKGPSWIGLKKKCFPVTIFFLSTNEIEIAFLMLVYIFLSLYNSETFILFIMQITLVFLLGLLGHIGRILIYLFILM